MRIRNLSYTFARPWLWLWIILPLASQSACSLNPALVPTPAPSLAAEPVTVVAERGAAVPGGEDAGVAPGAKDDRVVNLQRALAEAGFYRGRINGLYGPQTRSAVIALHKALDLPRSAAWQESDWEAVRGFQGPRLPKRPDEPDRVEIDLTRQLLYLVRNDQVIAILPVSTGNGELYQNAEGRLVRATTPRGHFALYRHHQGWRRSYLGDLYRPWYFRGSYALHGSGQVPTEPASHGCVRVPLWDADYLATALAIGMPVHVWEHPVP